MEKRRRTISNKPRKIVFLGGCEEFLIKMIFLEKQGNTICVQKVQKTRVSLQLSVFGKWHFCCNHSKSPNTTNTNRGFSGHKEKPKMAFLVAKAPFGEGASKGASLSVIPKAVRCSKHYLYSVFSKTTALLTSVTRKNRNLPRIRVCLSNAKGVFLV